MHRGIRAILRWGLVAATLALTGVGPDRSVADAPGRPISIADDFQGGVGPIWRLQRIRPDAIATVRDPTGLPRDVVAITLRSGDIADNGGVTERAELSEADHLHLPTGTDVWYGFSLYVPLDFPVVDRRLVLGQWKQGCGDCTADHSPGIANRYRNGVFSITIQDGDRRVVLFEEKADIRGPLESSRLPLEPHAPPGRLPAGVVQRAAGRGLPGPSRLPGRPGPRVLQDRAVSRYARRPDDGAPRAVPPRDQPRGGRPRRVAVTPPRGPPRGHG